MKKYIVDFRNKFGSEDFIGVNATSIESAIETVETAYNAKVFKVSVRNDQGKETVVWER